MIFLYERDLKTQCLICFFNLNAMLGVDIFISDVCFLEIGIFAFEILTRKLSEELLWYSNQRI